MLNEQQLLRAQELFTAAVSYNTCLHNAFVSEEDMVETDLFYNGVTERVSIPTYHYLLRTVDKLAKTVSQLQISDDGSDVVQLLSTANNLTLLYLQKRQFYVQSPQNAKLVGYDFETFPTIYSSADRTVLQIDMTDCKLPMDAQYVIATLDDNAPMRLPLIFKSTSFDKVANILSVSGSGDATTYMLDSNDLQVGMQVQCNSTVYKVTSVAGQSVQLEAMQLGIVKGIQAGDILYSITDATSAYLEVPVTKIHKTLTLQVQYMQLLSAKATYSLDNMANAIHQSLHVALSEVLRGASTQEALSAVATAMRPIAKDLQSIVQNSVPSIVKTTIRQTNTHQYVHSAIETMVKTNAVLMQAKEDIQRIEELINETTANILAAGGDVNNDSTLLAYNDQLASLKTRYQSAQAALASMNVAAQAVRPEYAATIYMKPTDSAGLPVVQYVARYQYLSFEDNDIVNNWQYISSNKRTVDADGNLQHDIDDYDILNSIQIPIHAYEQLVVQVAAVLQYGQPFLNIQTAWSNAMFLTIPEALLKEVSIDEMFKNAYEAKLYTNVNQALEAAGVYRHINPNVTYAHRAQDVQFDNDDTVYTKMQQLVRDITALQSAAASSDLSVYVQYKSTLYPVTANSQLVLTADAYCDAVFGNAEGEALQELLGTVQEETFEILVVNNSTETIYLHSIIPGNTDSDLSNTAWPAYADMPIIAETTITANNKTFKTNKTAKPTEGMAMYRGKQNAVGNRTLAIQTSADWNQTGMCVNSPSAIGSAEYMLRCFDKKQNGQLVEPTEAGFDTDQSIAMVSYGNSELDDSDAGIMGVVQFDYPGIGIHKGFPLFYGALSANSTPIDITEEASENLNASLIDFDNVFTNSNYAVLNAAKRVAMEAPLVSNIGANASDAGTTILSDSFLQPTEFTTVTQQFKSDNVTGERTYNALTRFDPNVHKYTSGRASRGSFMFIDTVDSIDDSQTEFAFNSLKLPIYGSSNAIQIQPGDKEHPGLRIRCKFQSRMCDRLGLTDKYAIVQRDATTGTLVPAKAGANFKYSKTINMSVKIGIQTISFDITMQMPWLQ